VADPLQCADIGRFRIDEAGMMLVFVFVDGVHAPALSSAAGDLAGEAAPEVVVGTVATALSARGALVEAHLGCLAGFQDRLFASPTGLR
jgi:hypothetical protein